jgi:hypothetical protein
MSFQAGGLRVARFRSCSSTGMIDPAMDLNWRFEPTITALTP